MYSTDQRLKLSPDEWSVDPSTGLLTISDAAIKTLISTDPIDQWYIVDPEPIARGQFAVVYHVYHRITGEEFAAKYSSRMRLGSDCTREILHEVAVCAMLHQAPSIVHLHQVFSTEHDLILVMEYGRGGDLQTLLEEDLVPYERDVISFMTQVLAALNHCHDLNIAHLDIKPQNLVLMGDFPDCAVKLCDFEISRMIKPGCDVREILGTPDYVAPEVIHYETLSQKTDIWSLGVLTYVLLTGFLPFNGHTDQEIFLEISRGEIDFPEELFEDISEPAIDFIKKLLVRRPRDRMSVKDCLNHPWIKSDMKKKPRKVPDSLPLFSTNQPLNNNKESYPNISSPQPLPPKPPSPCSAPSPFPNSKSNSNNKILPKSHSSHNLQNYAKTQPSSQITNTSSLNNQSLSFKNSGSAFAPVYSKSCSTVPTTPTSINSPALISALDNVQIDINREPCQERSCKSSDNTPRALTPLNATLAPVSSSSKDTGLPPPHPFTSRSAKSTHSSTCSLYKGPSRQNLERLRSISKSREVLFERLQNSSQKKALSRSRERFGEGLIGLARSRDQLLSQRSFSSSVDELSPLNWTQHGDGDSLYNSCSSVFFPLFQSLYMLPNIDGGSLIANRLSTLSVPKIDEVGSDENIVPSAFGSIDFDHYFDRETRRSSIRHQQRMENSLGGSRSKTRDDKKSDKCDKRSTESVFERLHSTPTECSSANKENKLSKKEKRKHDNNKRKGDDKTKVNLKLNSPKEEELGFSSHSSHSPKTKRVQHQKNKGCVSRIEQRIQERHERHKRQQEASSNRRGSLSYPIPPHKPSSLQKRNSNENVSIKDESRCTKNKTPLTQTNTSNKSKPISNKKNKSKKITSRENPICKDNTNEASSPKSNDFMSFFERETRMFNEINSKSPLLSRKVVRSSSAAVTKSSMRSLFNETSSNENIRKSEIDEAYISLEEPVDDGIFSRSESMDSSDTVKSNNTFITDDILDNQNESISNNEASDESDSEHSVVEVIVKSPVVQKSQLGSQDKISHQVDSLTVIKEDKEFSMSIPTIKVHNADEKISIPKMTRSISASTSSDIGSMFSESGEGSTGSSYSGNSTRASSEPLQNELTDLHFEWKARGRSKSIQSPTGTPLVPFELSRSNSVHLDTPLSGVAMHWEEVCSGAVSRAVEMFRQKSPDITVHSNKLIKPQKINLPKEENLHDL